MGGILTNILLFAILGVLIHNTWGVADKFYDEYKEHDDDYLI